MNADRNPFDGRSYRSRLNRAMALRRWFLIVAAPVVLLLTIWSVAQWQRWWLVLFP